LLSRLDPALLDYCSKTVESLKKFAEKLLSKYMLEDPPSKAEEIAEQLGDAKRYLSHGVVIDKDEAMKLGLKVEYLPPDDELWKLVWQLCCLYVTQMKSKNIAKIFESRRVHIRVS